MGPKPQPNGHFTRFDSPTAGESVLFYPNNGPPIRVASFPGEGTRGDAEALASALNAAITDGT